MIHPEYYWREFRAVGKTRRTIVPQQYLSHELEQLGGRPTDVHVSIFRYSNDLRTYRQDNNNRTSGYRGPAYADYLPIDVDAEDADHLNEAVVTQREIVRALCNQWGLSYNEITVYFSGRRGFHTLVPVEAFARFEPDPRFHDLLYEMVVELFRKTDLIYQVESSRSLPTFASDAIDFAPYTRLHMLRMPGTVHEGTQLWKIPVREHELMDGGPQPAADRIREAATDRRPPSAPSVHTSKARESLGQTLQERQEEGEYRYRQPQRVTGELDTSPHLTADELGDIDRPGFGRFAASARKSMRALAGGLEEGASIQDMNGRHEVLCHLVGKLKNQFDLPQDWAYALLWHWNQSNDPPLPESEMRHVVKSLYRS